MASLRTAFLETTRPHLNPFCSILAYIQPTAPLVWKTQDLENLPEIVQPLQVESAPVSPFFRPLLFPQQGIHQEINRFLNQNINSFSQISDQGSNDFKDCQNFVHCLSLVVQEDSSIRLSQLQTFRSETIVGQASTGAGSRKIFQEESDFSEVEDFEL